MDSCQHMQLRSIEDPVKCELSNGKIRINLFIIFKPTVSGGSHCLQNKQNNFLIVVTFSVCFLRSESPMLPNKKPANNRARDGKLAKIPASAKLKPRTCETKKYYNYNMLK